MNKWVELKTKLCSILHVGNLGNWEEYNLKRLASLIDEVILNKIEKEARLENITPNSYIFSKLIDIKLILNRSTGAEIKSLLKLIDKLDNNGIDAQWLK